MELVTSGWLNKQIGAALSLSEITVKVHRGKMMRKMKAVSLPDLVLKARTLGLKNVPTPNGSFFRSLESYAGTRKLLSQVHASTSRSAVTLRYDTSVTCRRCVPRKKHWAVG